MPGKLNSFQRTMFHWNDLYPYNALNVIRVPAAPDLERLRHVINRALEFHGLSRLSLGRDRRGFRYHGGPVDCPLKVLAPGRHPEDVLHAEIEAQLNAPFAPGETFNPFRCFVLPEAKNFALGLVYFHVIADAEAVLLLIRDIIEAYLSKGEPKFSRPLEIYPRHGINALSRPHLLARKLAALPGWLRNIRDSSRPRCCNPDDFSNRVRLFRLEPHQLDLLLKTARAWDLTVNDLLLALLLLCFSRQPSDRLRQGRRRKISVGCIVNLRKDLGLAGRRVFGPFLGSFVVTHELSAGITVRELARDIRRDTLAIKRSRLYFATDLQMGMGRFFFSRYSLARQVRMYPKHFPLWGGITNLNLKTLWPAAAGEKGFECLGAVSTGPLVPLVFSIITSGNAANVGITYRPVFYTDENIIQLESDFLSLLEQLPS